MFSMTTSTPEELARMLDIMQRRALAESKPSQLRDLAEAELVENQIENVFPLITDYGKIGRRVMVANGTEEEEVWGDRDFHPVED
jgi:hypothetical protein